MSAFSCALIAKVWRAKRAQALRGGEGAHLGERSTGPNSWRRPVRMVVADHNRFDELSDSAAE
jgi:hypothetical protein